MKECGAEKGMGAWDRKGVYCEEDVAGGGVGALLRLRESAGS